MSGSDLNIYFYQLYICYHFNFLIHHCSSFLATQNKKGPRLHSQDHSYLSICTYPSLSWAGPWNPWARAEPILTMMGNHSFYRTSPGLSVMAADLKTAWPVEHPAWLATGWGWRPYTGWSAHSLNSTSPNIDFLFCLEAIRELSTIAMKDIDLKRTNFGLVQHVQFASKFLVLHLFALWNLKPP